MHTHSHTHTLSLSHTPFRDAVDEMRAMTRQNFVVVDQTSAEETDRNQFWKQRQALHKHVQKQEQLRPLPSLLLQHLFEATQLAQLGSRLT